MFTRHSAEDRPTPLPGIRMKSLSYGSQTHMTEFRLSAGSTLTRHAHPHEQTGYLVSGHLKLTIGNEEYDVLPGDSWSIPGEVEHGAEVLEDSVAVEVFSPLRDDYLPGAQGED